jgi:hypothetical protein
VLKLLINQTLEQPKRRWRELELHLRFGIRTNGWRCILYGICIRGLHSF